MKPMKRLTIGDKIANLPIVQGGMGIGVSLSNLAAAVANEGGIGVISSAGLGLIHKKSTSYEENNLHGLRKEIRKARSLTDGILGINIMGAMTNYSDLVKVSIEEKIDIIFTGAGLPLDLPKYLDKDSTTKIVPIVSSGRAARMITRKWVNNYHYIPDAFVLEGPLAGGHLGFKKEQLTDPDITLESLLIDVLDALRPFEEEHHKKIPVIVAGGIYTGEDIHKFIERGAAGVQMATRFVTTDECDASDAFKQAYINAKKEDIVFIESPVGLPGRAIRNQYLDDMNKGLKRPFTCPYDCIHTCKKEKAPYCITLALFNAKNGKLDNGFIFAGSNAYLSDKIVSIKELIQTLQNEFIQAQLKTT